jgi:molybdopterin-binding protein
MYDDEQTIVEVTSKTRLFWRYWGWEIRYQGLLVGSILKLEHGQLNSIVTMQTTDGVSVTPLLSFNQAIAFVEANEGYVEAGLR